MGGDETPHLIFEAIRELAHTLPDKALVVVATQEIVDLLKEVDSKIEFVVAESSIEMGESPLLAVRRKRNSSMAVGMRLLKEKRIDAFVSIGNTGALLATAMLNLPLLPGISRPALMVTMPTAKGKVAVLDVGANITFSPEHLIDFAKMGTLYRHIVDGIEEPKIGLLNIGSEVEKGTKEMKLGYQILQENLSEHSFVGNIEGRDVFHGKVDVLVTDGFTGNVFLKTCEGASTFLMDYIKERKGEEGKNLFSHLYKTFNYAEHPGALLCGVSELVIKCHGYSSAKALINGVKGAFSLAQVNLMAKMKTKLEGLLC